jgi:hypothetical protein
MGNLICRKCGYYIGGPYSNDWIQYCGCKGCNEQLEVTEKTVAELRSLGYNNITCPTHGESQGFGD